MLTSSSLSIFFLSRTLFPVTFSLVYLYDANRVGLHKDGFNTAVSYKLGRTLLTCFTIFPCVSLGACALITVLLVMCSTRSIVLTRPTNAWRLKRRRKLRISSCRAVTSSSSVGCVLNGLLFSLILSICIASTNFDNFRLIPAMK